MGIYTIHTEQHSLGERTHFTSPRSSLTTFSLICGYLYFLPSTHPLPPHSANTAPASSSSSSMSSSETVILEQDHTIHERKRACCTLPVTVRESRFETQRGWSDTWDCSRTTVVASQKRPTIEDHHRNSRKLEPNATRLLLLLFSWSLLRRVLCSFCIHTYVAKGRVPVHHEEHSIATRRA